MSTNESVAAVTSYDSQSQTQPMSNLIGSSPPGSSPPECNFCEKTYQYREFVCGWGAAFVNITATFPMNKVMFRQQLHGVSVKSAIKQLQREGLFVLYRGVTPPLLQKTTNLSIMFGMYHQFQSLLADHVPSLTPRVNCCAAAMLAGTTEAVLAPFERVQTLLQDKRYHSHYRNTIHAFCELRHFGLQEYFRGFHAVLLRNGPSTTLFFFGRTEMRQHLPKAETRSETIALDFISGGLLGALISTLFFPINVVKTRMQSEVGTEFLSLRSAFTLVYNERGRRISKIFRGVHMNYSRSMVSWGIINATYELLKYHYYPERDES